MTPEQQAADRLRRWEDASLVDPHEYDDDPGEYSPGGDRVILSEAWIREHPADSQLVITKDWLLSIGGLKQEHPDKVTFERDDAMSIGLWTVSDGVKAMLLHAEHAASCIVRGLKTRGDVRRLCQALGIEVKGTPDAT